MLFRSISPNGDRIAASGSQSFFFAGRAGGSQNEFARRCLEPGEGGEAVVGGGGGLHFQKKLGGVWFGLVSVKNALDYHAHREFSTPFK